MAWACELLDRRKRRHALEVAVGVLGEGGLAERGERRSDAGVEADPFAPASPVGHEGIHDGRYVIPDFDGDEIHIRLEKSGDETKEVIVHRTRPTEVLGQGPLGYQGPQQTPGMVLVGLEWLPEIKDIMRQMPVVPDLLLVLFDPSIPVNMFGSGVVGVHSLNNMRVLAHEVCHAHQQWIVAPQGKYGGVGTRWDGTPEGKAYAVARQADWDEVGKSTLDLKPWTSSHREGAAEICARWWDVDRRPEFTRAWLRVNAPNRTRWAGDWLTKR